MKIANIVCTYPPYKGGIGTSAKEFVELMDDGKNEVITFTADYDNVKYGNDDKVIRLKSFLKYGNAAFLPQLFWRLKDFDVVYLNYPFFGAQEVVWLFLLFFTRKKKFIIRYHMDVIGLSFFAKILSLPSLIITNSIFKKADLIITASLDYVKNSNLQNIYKKNKAKFIEIPFSVNIDKFKPAKKEKHNFKILFVGGLDRAHYFKGVDVLLDAVVRIKNDNWELSIIGDGDLREQYEKKTKLLGISKAVKFLGKVSDDKLPQEYQSANVLVLPSINKCEAFGIVLIEAMAAGTPVIASNLAGVRSVFENNEQGLIVMPKNISDLTDKLEYLMKSPEKLIKMERAARELAMKKYSPNKIKERLNKVLMSL